MQTIFEIGLSNAVFATILAVAAFVVTRFCRAPALGHVLWLIVLIKLITPPLVSVPVSGLAPAWDKLFVRAAVSQNIRPVTVSSQLLSEEDLDEPDLVYLEPVRDAKRSLTPATSEAVTGHSLGSSLLALSAMAPSLHWDSSWNVPVLLLAWALGALLSFGTALVRIYQFQKLLRYARLASQSLQLEAGSIAERLGLAVCPSVWLAPGQFSPLLWAVGQRARLIIPADLLERLGPDQQASLLAHELAHARRRDHWVRWLELVVICLYWWHPVAWWARRELQQAEEQCCDAWVVWALPKAAKAYAKALLQTVEFLDARPALPPVASGIGHVHLLKRRLHMIVRKPLYPRLGWPAYLGVALLGVAVLPLGTSRLFAQTPSEDKVVITTDDDEDNIVIAIDDDDEQSGNQRGDIERRLDRLEQRMDKLLRSLESRQGRESRKTETSKDAKQEKKVIRVIRDSDDKDTKSQPEKKRIRIRTDNVDEEKVKELKKTLEDTVHKAVDPEKMKELHKRIEETVHRAVDPEKMKMLHKRIEDSVHQAVDPAKMEELQKRIKVLVDKNLDPEKMERLGKEIEENVRKNFDPKRMEQLGKQIEEAVKKGIDPERMERLGKEIEESVHKSFDPKKMEELGRHIEDIVKQKTKDTDEHADRAKQAAERAAQAAERTKRAAERAAERASRARSEAKKSTESKKASSSERDLERRIQKLEERLDRVLNKLESSKGDEEE
jgi:beta-lactamase regulating signal transducer with metallopeptidase domain